MEESVGGVVVWSFVHVGLNALGLFLEVETIMS